MKLWWATDLHLIDLAATDWSPLSRAASPQGSPPTGQPIDGLILTGDIAESKELSDALDQIADQSAVPVYFVLGNHDFYGNSIAATTRSVVNQVRDDPRLTYLTDALPIELAAGSFLIGDDGWGDATEGDYETSYVRLNDFNQIDDFRRLAPEHWKAKLQALGQQSAQRLSSKLEQLPTHAKHVLIATHVPPFCEACWYEGKTTDGNWAPFFVCGAIGKAIQAFADKHAHIKLTVICGHTHHDGVARISDNLIVYTGAATGGVPEIEAEVTVGSDGVMIQRLS